MSNTDRFLGQVEIVRKNPNPPKRRKVTRRAPVARDRANLTCELHQFRGCQDASCAPPPAGTGGSKPGGGSSATVDTGQGTRWTVVSDWAGGDRQYRVLHNGEPTDAPWALKHYGAINSAAMMTPAEQSALVESLNSVTASDIDTGGPLFGAFGLQLELAAGDTSAILPRRDDLPLSAILQASAVQELSNGAGGIPGSPAHENRAIARDLGLQLRTGDITAAEFSDRLAEATGVTPAVGAVQWAQRAWQRSATGPDTLALQRAAATERGIPDAQAAIDGYIGSRYGGADVIASSTAAYEQLSPALTAVVNGVYRQTQNVLAATDVYGTHGILNLHRGVQYEFDAEAGDTIQSNPLSSWTTDYGTARQFASGGGTVMTAGIPVTDVWSSARATGVGADFEYEFIAYGAPHQLAADTEGWRDRYTFTDGVELAFNPGQPRDERGRWTDGGMAEALGPLAEPDGGFTLRAADLSTMTTGLAVALSGADRLVVAADAFDKHQRPTRQLVDLVRDRINASVDFEAPDGTVKAIGGWHNPGDGKVEVNVTVVFPAGQRDAAFEFAREQDQIALADLDAISRGDWDNAILNTGGTGGERNTDDEALAASAG